MDKFFVLCVFVEVVEVGGFLSVGCWFDFVVLLVVCVVDVFEVLFGIVLLNCMMW